MNVCIYVFPEAYIYQKMDRKLHLYVNLCNVYTYFMAMPLLFSICM